MNGTIITAMGCKNCKFSVAAPSNNGMRECHFGPPTANAVMAPDGKGNVTLMGVVSVFPQMNPDAKCFKYERSLAIIADGASLKAVV